MGALFETLPRRQPLGRFARGVEGGGSIEQLLHRRLLRKTLPRDDDAGQRQPFQHLDSPHHSPMAQAGIMHGFITAVNAPEGL